MKRIFALLFLLPLLAFGAANDIIISQVNPAGTATVNRPFQPNSGTSFTTLPGFKTALGLGSGDTPSFAGLSLTSPLTGVNGGTGVANTGKTITVGGNTAFSGAFTFTGNVTGNTSVTFPTSGTLLSTTSGAAVASITGTAGNILANGSATVAQTGAVTLSLPANIYSLTSIGVGTGTTAAATGLHVVDTGTGTPRGITNDQYNTGINSAQFNVRKARGTFASPTTIVTGDILGRILAWGYDGSNFIESGNIRVTSSGTIAATRVPSQMEFYTSTDALPSVLTLAGKFDSAQKLTITNNLAMAGAITGANSVTSAAASNFALGTGTFGTFLTATSATGAVQLAAALGVSGEITQANNVASTSRTWNTNTNASGYAIFRAQAADVNHAVEFGIGGSSVGGEWQDWAVIGTSNSLTNGFKVLMAGTKAFSIAATSLNAAFFSTTSATNSTSGAVQIGNNIPSTNVGIGGGNVYVGGSLVGSGSTAPTTMTNGSNQFTAGIATSGPIYSAAITAAGVITALSSSNAKFSATTTASSGFGSYLVLDSSSIAGSTQWNLGTRGTSDSGGVGNFIIAQNTSEAFRLTLGTLSATFAGNLTVSGTGTSSFAGLIQSANTAVSTNAIIQATNSQAGQYSIFRATNTGASGQSFDFGVGGHTVGGSGQDNFFISNGSVWFSVSPTGVSTFGSTVSGTSTTAAAILGKSMGLTENLYVGGLLSVTNGLTSGSSGKTVNFDNGTGSSTLTLSNNSTTNYSYFRITNTGTSGQTFDFAVGGHAVGGSGQDSLYIANGTAILQNWTAGALSAAYTSIFSTLEATTGGAGSLTTAGGANITKTAIAKHFGGQGTAPTGAVGTGAGTSPSAVTFSATANDVGGIVNVTTGTLPTAAATVLTVTFNGAYATAPNIVLTAANAATALLSGATMIVPSSTTGTFVITAGATGLVAATTYSWYYHVIQ